MIYIIKKYVISVLVTCFFIGKANAAVEIEIPMLSYHIDDSATYTDAPNKIDDDAVWVLNPGVILGYDFRESVDDEGGSFLIKGGFLQDCGDQTALLAAAGGRYRKKTTNQTSIDLNGYIVVANAEDQFDSNPPPGLPVQLQNQRSRETTVLPIANLGFNYHLKSQKTLGFTLSYIPENTAIAATSGTDLLFLTVNHQF